MKDIEYWIWLSRIEGLSPKILSDLIEKYKEPKKIWNKTEEELIENGIKKTYAKKITDITYRRNLDKYIEYMR